MNDADRKLSAAELRREFDEAFAHPVATESEAREALLAIVAGGLELALRTSEVAAIHRCPTLTSVPSSHAALVGLAGVRGALVAVYSIAVLLGRDAGSARPGWIVSCRADRSAALLFDELIGHVSVARSDIRAAASAGGEAVHSGELVEVAGSNRALPSIAALLETIRGATKNRE